MQELFLNTQNKENNNRLRCNSYDFTVFPLHRLLSIAILLSFFVFFLVFVLFIFFILNIQNIYQTK